MFGEDRFDENEDFFMYYNSIGGKLPKDDLDRIIRSTYQYLDERYTDERYRHAFPSVEEAMANTLDRELSAEEKEKIINTFAFHELGHIPKEFVEVLHRLKKRFILSVVIDIWSPKDVWLEIFKKTGISELFSAASFSSDHGMVKPSPRPFELVVHRLDLTKEECLIVGDCVRRDLGGAIAARIDCILVGGAEDSKAIDYYPTLLEFCDDLAF